MDTRSDYGVSAVVPLLRRYGPPLSERRSLPDADAEGITEDLIRDVVAEFYGGRAAMDGSGRCSRRTCTSGTFTWRG
jgi:hypothetical protein